jgi:hypothetical protein
MLLITVVACLVLSGATKTIRLWDNKDMEMLEAVLSGRGHAPASGKARRSNLSSQQLEQQQQQLLPPVFVHTTIEMGGPWQPPVACASSTPGALVAGGFVLFMSTLVQVR